MSINTITFDLDEYTIQIVNGEVRIWLGDSIIVDPDVVLRLADLRRILSSADMLIQRVPT
jgi:hypothetical protein